MYVLIIFYFFILDLPSIVSGNVFAYLDPIVQVFPEELEFLDFTLREDKNKFHKSADFDLFKRLPDGFSINSSGYCDGSLFRFPLRRSVSDISSVCYDKKKVTALFETFRRDGHLNLLFLRKVKSIKLYKINLNGVLEELYAVESSQRSFGDYSLNKNKFLENITKSVEAAQFQTLSLHHFLELKVASEGMALPSYYSYAISEHFGYSGRDAFFDMIKDPELSYIPLVAVAMPIVGNDPGGHIFCGLPLPMREKRITGLPVHINGFFALGPDRKDLKWKTVSASESNDKSVNWNEGLIEKLVPVVYRNLLAFLIEMKQDADVIYRSWPCEKTVNSKWKLFLSDFYQKMFSLACIFVRAKKIWVLPKEALFMETTIFNSTAQCLANLKLLEALGENVSLVPDHVLACLSNRVNKVSKTTLQSSLKRASHIYLNMGKDDKCKVLSFVLQSHADFNAMVGSRLIPLMNNNFESIQSIYHASNGKSIYIPTYDHPKELLPSLTNVLDESFFINDAVLFNLFKQAAQSGIFLFLFVKGELRSKPVF